MVRALTAGAYVSPNLICCTYHKKIIPVFMNVTLSIVFDLYKRVDVFAQAAFCNPDWQLYQTSWQYFRKITFMFKESDAL